MASPSLLHLSVASPTHSAVLLPSLPVAHRARGADRLPLQELQVADRPLRPVRRQLRRAQQDVRGRHPHLPRVQHSPGGQCASPGPQSARCPSAFSSPFSCSQRVTAARALPSCADLSPYPTAAVAHTPSQDTTLEPLSCLRPRLSSHSRPSFCPIPTVPRDGRRELCTERTSPELLRPHCRPEPSSPPPTTHKPETDSRPDAPRLPLLPAPRSSGRHSALFQANRGEANDEAREAQARELRDFIAAQNIPASEPVVITGDFNIDYHTQVRGHSGEVTTQVREHTQVKRPHTAEGPHTGEATTQVEGPRR